ncbi:MAG: IS21 family transposase [Clostridia bacterium]|nr:IS21 family transposase [Clostridia bacterium]
MHTRGDEGLITLHEKQKIIVAAFIEGKAKRQIAREEGIDVKTVRRYIKKYQEDIQNIRLPQKEGDRRILVDSIVEPPKYDVSSRVPTKLTPEICRRINELISINKERRDRGMFKQQMRKIDIFEILCSEGYDISYTTVCNKITSILSTGKEAFIKAEYEKGDVCEFDWGDVKLLIEGKQRILQMAVFASAYGNFRCAVLMPKQDTECFVESHARFFESISNVYKTMVYDNMKTAVRKFVGYLEKEPTEALLKLSLYYGFKFRFCNVRAGNEKPHVERSVDYVRHKAFSAKVEFDSLEQANHHLLEVCQKLNQIPQKSKDNKSAMQLLEEERPFLLPAMPVYDAAKILEPRVDKYSTVVIGNCHYSVPDNHVGKLVVAKVYSNLVQFFYEGKLIAEHPRLHGFNQWSMKIEHFLKTLSRKPGALHSSTAMLQADPRLQKIYQTYFIKKEKDFIELLQLIPEKSIEEIERAILLLRKLNPFDLNTDMIKLLLDRNSSSTEQSRVNTLRNDEISKIEESARAQLNAFKELIPCSNHDFIQGGILI